MDLSRLRTGEKIAGISGIALLLIMFIFDWFTVSAGGDAAFGIDVSVGGNAFDTMEWTQWFILLAALAGIALGAFALSDSEVNLPVATSALATAFGILAVLLIIWKIIDPPGGDVEGFGVEVGRGIGVFLGLVAAAGVTYGGWTAMQEEGTSFGDQADRFRGGGSDAPPPPPPPAPPAA